MQKFTFRVVTFLFLNCFFQSNLTAQVNCTGQPENNTITASAYTICQGSTVSLSLLNTYTASGITFQWQSSNVSQVGPFSNIPGATSPTYTSGPLSSTTYYKIIVTCANSGQTFQAYLTITVIPCATPCNGTPGQTSIVPATQSICAGTTANLSLSTTYTNQSGITFQWGSSNSPGGPFLAILGATNSAFSTPTLNALTYYNVIITCTNSGLTFTNLAYVSVINCTYCAGAPPSNTIIPSSYTVCQGGVVSLSLANTYTASGLSYQWQSSNVSQVGPFTPLAGATSNTYTSNSLTTTTYFQVVITCTNGGAFTVANLSISVLPCNTPCSGTPSATTILPIHPVVCTGSNIALSLNTSYAFITGITYQWGSSSVATGPFLPISGATLNAYTTPTLSSNMYYSIIVTCTNSGQTFTTGLLVSVSACTDCAGAPNANTIIPLSYTVCEGASASLSLANSYTSTGISYQWQSSTLSPVGPFSSISGATLSSYVSPTLSLGNYYYQVVITCSNGGLSTSANLSISAVPCDTTTPNTGLTEANLPIEGIRVFPNPVGSYFVIDAGSKGRMSIYSVLGERIYVSSYDEGLNTFNTHDLAEGIYFLQLDSGNHIEKVKLVVCKP